MGGYCIMFVRFREEMRLDQMGFGLPAVSERSGVGLCKYKRQQRNSSSNHCNIPPFCLEYGIEQYRPLMRT